MNIIITIIATVVLASGIFVNQKLNGPEAKEPGVAVLSEEVTTDDKNTTTPTPLSVNDTNKSSLGAEANGIDIDEDVNDQGQLTNKPDIGNYIYPDSSVISRDGSQLHLESDAESDTITEWYKTKIASSGMNVKTFAKTKANDKVLNKLVATDGVEQIAVEISRQSGADTVKIIVSLDKLS
jgi:hypothetical protein